MRKLTAVVLTGIMLAATLAYGNGDLLVSGKVGVGFTSPRGRIDIGQDLGFGKGLFIGDYLEINEREVINNALSIGFNASIAADDGTYAPGYARGTGMVLSTAAGGVSDLDFWGINWLGSNTPVNLNSFTHVMRLSTNGNVGIGTTSPSSKLHVIGGDSSTANTKIEAPIYPMVDFLSQNTDLNNRNWRIASVFNHYGTFEILNSSGPNGTPNQSRLVITNDGNVGIGITDPGSYKLYVAGPAYTSSSWQSSDAKFKKNLLPVTTPLDKVLGLNGHSYEWKTDEYKGKNFPEGRHYGVIAQEVEKVLPEVVNTDAKGEKSVAYTEIIPVLIEAIKEQQKLIEKQQKLVENQQQRLDQLEKKQQQTQ